MTCPNIEPEVALLWLLQLSSSGPGSVAHLPTVSVWLCLSPQIDSTGPKRAPELWYANSMWRLAQLRSHLSAEDGRNWGQGVWGHSRTGCGPGKVRFLVESLRPTDAAPFLEHPAAEPACSQLIWLLICSLGSEAFWFGAPWNEKSPTKRGF